MALTTKLRELREAKGLSGAAVAKMIGFSPTMLSRIESGVAYPSAERIVALAEVYGVPVLELVAEEAVDRRRIEVPAGVSDDDLRAAVYRLAGQVAPEPRPVDPQSYLCPECGAELRCVARPKD
jgi:transcriptional regulator with XRE-family HTH domain